MTADSWAEKAPPLFPRKIYVKLFNYDHIHSRKEESSPSVTEPSLEIFQNEKLHAVIVFNVQYAADESSSIRRNKQYSNSLRT
jgi:hypothetical protein